MLAREKSKDQLKCFIVEEMALYYCVTRAKTRKNLGPKIPWASSVQVKCTTDYSFIPSTVLTGICSLFCFFILIQWSEEFWISVPKGSNASITLNFSSYQNLSLQYSWWHFLDINEIIKESPPFKIHYGGEWLLIHIRWTCRCSPTCGCTRVGEQSMSYQCTSFNKVIK
jgi:hypothetical protein